jgi:hypothetical protein
VKEHVPDEQIQTRSKKKQPLKQTSIASTAILFSSQQASDSSSIVVVGGIDDKFYA